MPKRSYEPHEGFSLASSSRGAAQRHNPGTVIQRRIPRNPVVHRVSPGYTRRVGYYGRYTVPFTGTDKPGELKFFDVDVNDGVVSNTGTVFDSVCKIAQGVTEVQRVGRKCTLKTIQFRWRVILPALDNVPAPLPADAVRFIVFLDKQCNGAIAGVTQILHTANYKAFYNLVNQGRFKILHDQMTTMNYGGLASEAAGQLTALVVQKDFYWEKAVNIPLEFDGATGALTEIRSNNIGVLLISTQGTLNFESKVRLRFSDS